MIEKWLETDESMEEWLDEVHSRVESKLYKCFESEIEVTYGFKNEGDVIIKFEEACYDVSDERDDNIKSIKQFVSEELPYLRIKEIKNTYDPDDVGFEVILEVEK